jgi:hypothetical protein
MNKLRTFGDIPIPESVKFRLGGMYDYLRYKGFLMAHFAVVYRREPGFPRVYFVKAVKDKITQEVKDKIKSPGMTYTVSTNETI